MDFLALDHNRIPIRGHLGAHLASIKEPSDDDRLAGDCAGVCGGAMDRGSRNPSNKRC